MILDGNGKPGQAKVYGTPKEMTLQKEIDELKAKLELAIKALEHYANRMDDGGTARKALEEIRKE